MKTLWSWVPPALQLSQLFSAATGRQMRKSPDGGMPIKSTVVVFAEPLLKFRLDIRRLILTFAPLPIRAGPHGMLTPAAG